MRDDGTILFYFTPSRTLIIETETIPSQPTHTRGEKGISALLIPFTYPSCEVSNMYVFNEPTLIYYLFQAQYWIQLYWVSNHIYCNKSFANMIAISIVHMRSMTLFSAIGLVRKLRHNVQHKHIICSSLHFIGRPSIAVLHNI